MTKRNAAIERWLREEVVPTYDEIRAHPERGIPAEKIFADLRAYHNRQMKKLKRGSFK